jgi:hypothetical protein
MIVAMPKNERPTSKTAARAKALRHRANRRRQDQPLENLGTVVDPELAEEIESRVFHRKPAESRTRSGASLGREVAARQRRRAELVSATLARRGNRGRVLTDLEEDG